MRVALFTTCLADGLVPDVARACVSLLRRLGVDVSVPGGQTCCGQMHINTGYAAQALPLVRNHVRAFAGFDAVVAPSASCVGSVRHQHADLARQHGDETLAGAAGQIAGRTYELSEFLVDVLGLDDVGAWFPHRVTYHPTCHSLRVLRVGDKPLRLLRSVRGLELVELAGSDECCGFGGTFALKNAPVSAAMLSDKLDAIARTEADVCAGADSSCLLHIGGGLSRQGRPTRTVHLGQILASTEADPWT
jgi:L-lactate dehydrogenase complex protein LldE